MKTKRNSGIFVLICCFAFYSCSPNIDLESEKKAVLDFQKSFEKMFQEKNIEQLVNRFTKDGSVKIPGNPIAMGHEALKGNYSAISGMDNFQLTLKVISINMANSGDWAYTHNDYAVCFDTPNGSFSETGKSLIVYKKVKGEWKIVNENLSNNPTPSN